MEPKQIDIYTEFGIGNPTFVSTELEYPDGTEERIPGFASMKVEGLYIRIWVGSRVLILSTKDGIKRRTKSRHGLKILFGMQGSEK